MKRKAKYDLLKIKLHLWDRIVISFIPVLFFLISGAFFFMVRNFVHRQLDTINTSLTDVNYVISLQLNDYVMEKAKILESIAKFPDIYEMDNFRQKKFVDTYAGSNGFRNIFFVNNNGISYYPETNRTKDQSKEPFFSDIKDADFFCYCSLLSFDPALYNSLSSYKRSCGSSERHYLWNNLPEFPADYDAQV